MDSQLKHPLEQLSQARGKHCPRCLKSLGHDSIRSRGCKSVHLKELPLDFLCGDRRDAFPLLREPLLHLLATPLSPLFELGGRRASRKKPLRKHIYFPCIFSRPSAIKRAKIFDF